MALSASSAKQAIARMRSSTVSINDGDPTGPIGSGVIVRVTNDHDGIVATALHVVNGVDAEDLQIGIPLPQSEENRGAMTMLDATVIATDEGNDLALLQISGRLHASAADLDGERPEEGEIVMISGFPLGYRYVVHSSGIIGCSWGDHAIDQFLDERAKGTAHEALDRYLVDISVNAGNSGGPCYRVADQGVVGICEALKLIEVDFDETSTDDPPAPDEAQGAALQKADITFVVPAKYVIALLETV